MVVELGEVREELEKNEAVVLDKIIQRCSDKESYYVLKHSAWEGVLSNTMRTRYTLRSRKPKIPIVGTKLWLISNKESTITLEWDLPMDIIGTEPFVDEDNVVEANYNSACQNGFAVWNAR